MFITVALVSAMSAGLVIATNAFAQTRSQNSAPSLVQEIASKFNLSQSDVQAVFTEHRAQMRAKMESNYETYLGNLVKSGKITEEQEQLILSEHKQLVNQMQATMKQKQNWATQNNIKIQYLQLNNS